MSEPVIQGDRDLPEICGNKEPLFLQSRSGKLERRHYSIVAVSTFPLIFVPYFLIFFFVPENFDQMLEILEPRLVFILVGLPLVGYLAYLLVLLFRIVTIPKEIFEIVFDNGLYFFSRSTGGKQIYLASNEIITISQFHITTSEDKLPLDDDGGITTGEDRSLIVTLVMDALFRIGRIFRRLDTSLQMMIEFKINSPRKKSIGLSPKSHQYSMFIIRDQVKGFLRALMQSRMSEMVEASPLERLDKVFSPPNNE